MASNLSFHYIPCEKGFLYTWDARCKWAAFIPLNMAILLTGYYGAFLMSVFFTVVTLRHSPNLRKNLVIPPTWSLFLAVIFIMNIVEIDGWEHVYINLHQIAPSALLCWKIVLMIFSAMLLTATTRPSDTVMALTYYLRFLPLSWNHRISLMITLVLRFIPILLGEYSSIQEALYLRCGRRRNPLCFFRWCIVPFVTRVLRQTETIADAIWARGYREDLPVSFYPIPSKSILQLIGALTFAIFIMIVDAFVKVVL
ncbi:MAG: energy-coupling factor transporter transmembrane protein EcfT [Deltaproteobacteria bacterium]|nr:energy-coupling factor transporter transmembrane protein EcfT [Deltaproteobacteria bacterium]